MGDSHGMTSAGRQHLHCTRATPRPQTVHIEFYLAVYNKLYLMPLMGVRWRSFTIRGDIFNHLDIAATCDTKDDFVVRVVNGFELVSRGNSWGHLNICHFFAPLRIEFRY